MNEAGKKKNVKWTEITPKGIRKSPRSFDETITLLKDSLTRARFIVTSEIKARVFGKSLGWGWLVVEPLMMAWIYYFISAVIFAFRPTDMNQFLFILVAVMFWRWFSKIVDGSPNVITSHSAALTQTNFPVTLLFVIFIGAETALFCVNLGVLAVFLIIFQVYPGTALVALPLVMLSQLSLAVMLAIPLSVLGVFFKDASGFLVAITAIWWYVSPGMYPVELVEKNAPNIVWIYNLNPFAHYLVAYRQIFLDNTIPSLGPILAILVVCSTISWLELSFFQKARYFYFKYL